MKKGLVIASVIVLVVCVVFLIFGTRSSDKENSKGSEQAQSKKVTEIVTQIDTNNDLRTYINNIDLYNKLIELDPNNIDWYVGLANTYNDLGQSFKYKKTCKEIINKFPNDKTGHLMLMKFYAAKKSDRYIITTYHSAPPNVKSDPEFIDIYEKSEWVYRSLGKKRYQSIGTYSNGYYVYESEGLYGYKSKNMMGGIVARFTIARPFIEDYAAVYEGGEWYFINQTGYRTLAAQNKLEDLYSISEGYAVAKINGKYGYVDSSFKQYSFEYEDATSFYNGVAAVKKDGKWALINSDFKPITAFVYDSVVRDDANVCSREEVIWLSKNDGYHLVNTKGKEVSSTVYENVRPFYSENAAVKKNGKWGFVNISGNVVYDFVFEDASSSAFDVVAVKKDGKWGCVSLDGKTVIPFEYDYASVSSDNGVVVLKTTNDRYQIYQFKKFLYVTAE